MKKHSVSKSLPLPIPSGNPYPSIFPDRVNNSKSLLHNILLAEASKEYYRKKTADAAADAEGKPSEVD